MYQQGFGDYTNIVGTENGTGYESDYAELASILMDGAHSYGCSRLHFDTREELLWSGSESGHITRSRSNITFQGTGLRLSENESIFLGHFRPF